MDEFHRREHEPVDGREADAPHIGRCSPEGEVLREVARPHGPVLHLEPRTP
ncbi:hypothetical protein [Methanoculleus chikugoensis]|uniref:hypothetical protein n=1 Tax=Methanoculleus chikugoensis TaxID=118126 RepID=UPI001FB3ED30|nr:hypothetical protein [Methanoculleus chikugoensis]